MANELGTGGLLGALTGKNGANASSVSSHHTAMVTGASGRAKDAAAPMITIGNMTVNNDSSDGSVIKTIENSNQYKPADTSMLKMGGFFSTATGKLETSINKQTELIEKQSAAIVGKLEGIQAAVVEMNQAINKAMSAQISSFESYSEFVKKQNAKTTLLHDAWMVISKGAREKEAAEKSYYNANQIAVWSKTDTTSLTKTIPNALAKINENLVTRFTDPKVRRIFISETLKHYQRVHELMQDIIVGIENIRHNTHPIDQYVKHEFDVYNRAHHLGPYNPHQPNPQPIPRRQAAYLKRTRDFDTLTMDDIEKALGRKGTYTINGVQTNATLWKAMKDRNHNLKYNKLDITDFLSGRSPDQKKLKKAFLSNIKKNKKKNSATDISDKNLKALIAPTEKLTKATMLSASSSYALQGQMKRLGLAVDTSTSTVEKASSAMSAAMKLFTRFVNFKNIWSLLFKLLKFYSIFRTGKSILGLVRGGIGLASSGSDKISSGFNWLKDRVPFVKSISDAIGGWWEKTKNYFLDKIGPTIETYVTTPIVEKTTSLFDRVFGAGAFKDALDNVSKYSRLIFTTAFGQDPAKREQAWSTLKNGIVSGYETVVKKYIIPAIAKVAFTAYSLKNFTKTVAKIPGAFSTLGKMWDAGYTSGNWANFRAGFVNAYGDIRHGNFRGAARGIKSGINAKFNLGKAASFLPGVNYFKEAWNGRKVIDAAGNASYNGGIHQGLKDFVQPYNAVIRGISNLFGSTAANNGNPGQGKTDSTFDLYKSIENRLHSIGSAPKTVWNFAKDAYHGRTHVTQSLMNTFGHLKDSIKDLPGKFTAMRNAFGGNGATVWAGVKGLGTGIGKALTGGTSILAGLAPLAKGLAKLATGVGIPIAIIAFLIKMILPAFRSAQSKGIGVGQYLKDTIVGWFESIKKTLYTEVGGFGGLAKMVVSGIAGVLEGIWIGIKSLFNADSAAGLIINIGKALLSGIVAVIPYLFKLIGKGLKTTLWDIPKALLWDLPKMLISSLFGSSSGDKIKVKAHAKGGIVDSPTYFKFGKGGTTQTGLMGEAGPEAILKLKKGKDGVLGVSIADSSNSLQQAIKSLDRTNAVTSTAMKRLTDAITRPNSFYDPKTVKQFTSTFKKLNISSDKMSQLSDIVKKNAGKEVTVDNINELVDVLNGISSEQKDGNKSQKKTNADQTKRDTERNKTLTDSKKVSETIKENLPEKGFWNSLVGWIARDDTKRSFSRLFASLFGDNSYIKTTDAKSINTFGVDVKGVAEVLRDAFNEADRNANEFLLYHRFDNDDKWEKSKAEALEKLNKLNNLFKAYEDDSFTESDEKDIKDLIETNGERVLGYNPLGSQSGKAYNADNLVKILAESEKFNKDTLDGVRDVLVNNNGILQGETIQHFMAAINKTPDFSLEILDKIKEAIIEQNGKEVTEDTMNKIVEIVGDIKKNQEEDANNNSEENAAENTFKKTLQNQIKSIKEYFIGGKFYADIDKAKMTVGGIMKTIGNSIYSLITGKQNAVIGNALKDTFGAGFGGLAAGLMGDSRAYEFISKINENAVKHGHSDIQRMMTSAKHTILSDVSDIAQFTKDTKITSEELASILKDAERYGWNINSESFKKLDAQIKGIPYVPEGKDGKTNTQTEGTSATQGSGGKVVSSNNAGQILIHTPTRTAKRIEFDAKHLDKSSEESLLRSIKKAYDAATDDRTKATYSKLSEAVSTGKFESLSELDWKTLKNVSPENKDAVSKMQGTINDVRFETYTNKLLNTEGGYVSYKDKNGVLHEDNRGISKGTLSVAIAKGIIPKGTNIKDLTAEQAIEIYKKMYWDVKDGPKMYKLPHPIDYLVYDTHVNGGALNVLHNTLKELGVNGYDKAGFDKTFGAVIDYCQSPEKTKKFGETFLKARGKYYIDVVKRDNTKSNWLQGWFNRLEIISKQTGLESPFKDGTLVVEANKLMNEINPGKSIKITDTSTVKEAAKNASSDESANDSGSINVEKLNEKATEQATANRNNLIKFVGKLISITRGKKTDLSMSPNKPRNFNELLNEYNETEENLSNILKNLKNGLDPSESDTKLINTLAETYKVKFIDYDLYKFIDNLRGKANDKARELATTADSAESIYGDIDEYNKKVKDVEEVEKYLGNIRKNLNNGPGLTEFDTKRINDIAKAYGENTFDFSSYKTVAEAKSGTATSSEQTTSTSNGVFGWISNKLDNAKRGVSRTWSRVTGNYRNTKTTNAQSIDTFGINVDDLAKIINILYYNATGEASRLSYLYEHGPNRHSDELKNQLDVAQKEESNLDNILKKIEKGQPLADSEIKFVNDLVKDYGEKILGYDPYKKVVDETKAEQAKKQAKSATATGDSTQSTNVVPAKQNIKVADGYLDFVENMIHEAELDRKGRSRMDLIRIANSGEPTDTSKIESLKKIYDELKAGSISPSTMDFLNENQDNFDAYRSWNAKATQFEMSGVAKSGLIELLKKKKDIAAKDKDGGLFTSNSTMVAAKRTYEALDRAINEVQTDSLTNASMNFLFGDKDLYKYVKNLSFQPTTLDETFSKEIPDSEFDLSKTAEKSNIKYQQMVQQALAQVTDEDFKKNPYTALQNAVDALREATALQYVALTKMERPNVANVNNATVSTNSNSSIFANQSNTDDSYGHTNPLDAWMSGSNAILSSSQYWSL